MRLKDFISCACSRNIDKLRMAHTCVNCQRVCCFVRNGTCCVCNQLCRPRCRPRTRQLRRNFSSVRSLLYFVFILVGSTSNDVFADGCNWQNGSCFGVSWPQCEMHHIQGLKSNVRDEKGRTPLHWAARFCEKPEIITALHDRGNNVNVMSGSVFYPIDWVNLQRTPLEFASSHNSAGVVEALVRAGAQTTASEPNGMSALHFAAKHNPSVEVARVLSDATANHCKLTSRHGLTPFQTAIVYDQIDVARVLFCGIDDWGKLNDIVGKEKLVRIKEQF